MTKLTHVELWDAVTSLAERCLKGHFSDRPDRDLEHVRSIAILNGMSEKIADAAIATVKDQLKGID